jgi:autotransporter-associated beta strand protein
MSCWWLTGSGRKCRTSLRQRSIAFGLGSSTYNLDGGELQIGVANPLVALGGAHAFNFGDGTIRAMVNFSTALDFNMTGASTVDTFDGAVGHTVTMSGPMQGAGSLTKAGTGTLIFTSAKTYTGGTEVAGGTLQLGVGGNLAPTGAEGRCGRLRRPDARTDLPLRRDWYRLWHCGRPAGAEQRADRSRHRRHARHECCSGRLAEDIEDDGIQGRLTSRF